MHRRGDANSLIPLSWVTNCTHDEFVDSRCKFLAKGRCKTSAKRGPGDRVVNVAADYGRIAKARAGRHRPDDWEFGVSQSPSEHEVRGLQSSQHHPQACDQQER